MGFAEATYRIGTFYDLKGLLPPDQKMAQEWLLKAAGQGEVEAQFRLGEWYQFGQGVSTDYAKAVEWFRSAAEQGKMEAEYKLGFMAHEGLGMPRNLREAFDWLSRSAGKGYAPAQYFLGKMYFAGEGTAPDAVQGYRWSLAALQGGENEASKSLESFDWYLGPEMSKRARECAARVVALPNGAETPEECRITVPVREGGILIVRGRGGADMGVGSPIRGDERVYVPGRLPHHDGPRPTVEFRKGEKPDVVYRDKDGKTIFRESEEPEAFLSAAYRYLSIANYPMAHEYAKKALSHARQTKDRRAEARALSALGSVFRVYADYEAALQNLQAALGLYEDAGSEGQELLTAFANLSHLYWDIGDYDRAIEVSSEALVFARRSQNSVWIAAALNNLGASWLFADEPAEAQPFLQEALGLIEQAPILNTNIARAQLAMGQTAEAAEVFTKNGDYYDLARVRLAEGRFSEARRLLEAEFKKWEKMGQRELVIANAIGMGQCSEGQGDGDRALRHYSDAVDLLERIRDGTAPAFRLGLMGASSNFLKHLEAFEGLVRLSTTGSGGWAESFLRAEFTHSRTFSEAIGRKRGSLRHLIPKGLAEEDERLAGDIQARSRDLNRAFFLNDREELSKLQPDLDSLKERRRSLVEGLHREYPRYAWAKYPRPVPVDSIPLKTGEVLIEYEVMERFTRVFVVKPGAGLSVLDLPAPRAKVVAAVRGYLRTFAETSGTTDLARFNPRAGWELYSLVLKPVLTGVDRQGRPLVVKSSRLIIVPDEILGNLPFEALVAALPGVLEMPSGPHGPVPVGVKYVGDEWDIAYFQSATALATQRKVPRKGGPSSRALIVADPIFSPSDGRVRGTMLTGSQQQSPDQLKTMGAMAQAMGFGGKRAGSADSKVIGPDGVLFPRLHLTSILGHALLEKVFHEEGSVMLAGSTASKAELLRQDLASFRYIVFATHGLLGRAVHGIREPALVLNQVGNKTVEDGFLTMSDVMALDLNADVVALTACRTGLGRQVSGEGVVGLGRAFQQAGARNVIVSLWGVAEDSSVRLTEEFFRHLRAGKTPREAIRSARAAVRREGYEHPFYWAPFILFGE